MQFTDTDGALILVATDGSEPAEAATRFAIELAKETGDRLLLVTVWRELRGDFGLPLRVLVPELMDVERDRADDVLRAAATEAEAARVEAETISRHGAAVDEICAVARDRQPRMIAIGSHGWGPIERAVFGSVSSGVLHHASCPVLVVPAPVKTPNAPRDTDADGVL